MKRQSTQFSESRKKSNDLYRCRSASGNPITISI